MNERKESSPQDVSLSNLAETSPVAITKVDRNGEIVYANSKAKEVLGLDKDEITDRTYDDPDWKITNFEGNDYPTEDLPFELVKETGEPVENVRHAIEWPDGERKLLSVNATPLFDEDSEFDGMEAVIEDITEHRQTEKALKASEQRYRRLFETAQDGMLILNADTGEIIDANPYIRDLLGFSKQELVDKQLWQIGTFQDVVENRDKFQKLVEEGYIRYEHLPLKTKSGEEASVEFVSNTYMVDSQKIVQCNIRDITERKRLEEKREELIYDLGERYKELNLLHEVTKLAVEKDNTLEDIFTETVDLIPPSWQYPDITCAKITYEGDEYKTKGFKETEWGQTRDLVVEDQKIGTVEVYYLEEKPEEDEGPFLDEEKDLIDSLGHTLGQIIYRRQLEQRKEHLTSVLRSIRDVNQLLVKEDDRDKLIEGICDILVEGRGYHNVWIALLDEDKELLASSQKGLGDSFGPMLERLEDRDLPETTRQALDQPGVVVTTDPQANCSNCPLSNNYEDRGALTARLAYQGKVYGVITASTPRQYAEDEEERVLFEEVAGDIGFGLHDIEVEKKRKQALQEISEKEKRLELALYGGNLGTWNWNVKTDEVKFNQRWARMIGYELEEIEPHLSTWKEMVHPADLPEARKKSDEHLEGKTDYYEAEYRMQHKSGDWIWVLDKGKVIERDEEGNPIRACGTHLDITSRKKAESKLEEERDRAQRYLDIAGSIIVLIDQDRKVKQINKKGCELLGYERDEIIGKNWYENFVPERVRDDVVEDTRKPLMEGDITEGTRYENPILTKDGEEKVIAWENGVLREDGEIVGTLSSGIDITERKQAERKIRQNEKRFRSYVESSPFGIFIADETGDYLDVNKAATRITGYQEEDLLDMNLVDLIPEDNKEAARKSFDSLRKQGEVTTEIPFVRKDGTRRYWSVKAVNLSPDRFLGFVEDITERKSLEKQIKADRDKIQDSFIELAETTSRVLGVRDPYTQKHEQKVGELAREVGERMGLSEEKLLGLYIGGVLHDIGKIIVPETILTKPGELKDVEWRMIKSHPEVGYNQILEDTDFPWPVAELTLHHHERLDGSGYPDGLEGDDLTTEVRILGAVDVVEAMSTRRPYREARSKERTLNVIKEGNGDKFDPEVVDILISMIEEGEVEFG